MGKEKFVYNNQTLRYEKVVEPLKIKVLRVFAFTCAFILFAFLAYIILDATLESPKDRAMKRELRQMKTQYKALSSKMDSYGKVLNNIKDRQEGAFGMAFGMNPIDEDVWEVGIGGVDRYSNLTKYPTTGDLMMDVTKKADKLGRRMVLLSHSLDSVMALAKNRDEMYAAVPTIKPIREDKLNRKITLLSGFGMRLHPIHKVMRPHKGIDFSCPKGTPIYVTGNGKVIKVEKKKTGYGWNVRVSHGYGYQTLYAHMSKIDVKVGQEVKKGEVIGLVGSTGTSTSPHLHYEVHYLGKAVNPIHYVLDGLSTEEYQNMVDMSSLNNQSFD